MKVIISCKAGVKSCVLTLAIGGTRHQGPFCSIFDPVVDCCPYVVMSPKEVGMC